MKTFLCCLIPALFMLMPAMAQAGDSLTVAQDSSALAGHIVTEQTESQNDGLLIPALVMVASVIAAAVIALFCLGCLFCVIICVGFMMGGFAGWSFSWILTGGRKKYTNWFAAFMSIGFAFVGTALGIAGLPLAANVRHEPVPLSDWFTVPLLCGLAGFGVGFGMMRIFLLLVEWVARQVIASARNRSI